MLQVTNSHAVRPFWDSNSVVIPSPPHQFWAWSSAVWTRWIHTYRLGICSGWRSPTGSPSGVKYFSNSLASSNVSDSRWLSLCPSNWSDEHANIETLKKRKRKTKVYFFLFNAIILWYQKKKITASLEQLNVFPKYNEQGCSLGTFTQMFMINYTGCKFSTILLK